jgi:hypothetical protein
VTGTWRALPLAQRACRQARIPARAGTGNAWVAPPSNREMRGHRRDAQKWAPRGGPSVASRREAKCYRAGCSATGPPSLRGRYSSRRHATRATTAQRSATAATFLVTVTPIIAMEEPSITSRPRCSQHMIDAKCHFSVRRCAEATVDFRYPKATRGWTAQGSKSLD